MFNGISHISLLKASSYIPVLLCAIMVILLPFAYDERLMDAIQSTKTFWFAGFVSAMVNLILIWKFFIYKTEWNIKSLDIVLFVYFIYTISHPYIFDYEVAPYVWIETLSLATFYFIVRQIPKKQLPILVMGVITSCLVQSIYGSLQLYGFYPSNHALFNITGSFFNPGPFAGYIVIGLPLTLGIYISPHCISLIRLQDLTLKLPSWIQPIFKNQESFKLPSGNKLLKFFSQLAITSILLVLPASRSRAAWVGGALGCLLMTWLFRKEIKSRITKPFNLKKYDYLLKPRWIALTILIISIPAIAFVYKYKQASADGRLFIWKVSSQMIADKPIFGHGVDKFKAYYMNYQADYFKDYPDAPEAMVADNVQYSYNDFVKVGVEKGIVGVSITLVIFFFLLQSVKSKERSPFQLILISGLLALIGFSFFSYPSEILSINIVFIVLVAILGSMQQSAVYKYVIYTSVLHSFIISFLIVLTSFTCYKILPNLENVYKAYINWKDASDIYNVRAYKESLEDFEFSYPTLRRNGEFIVQYGKALEMAGLYFDASKLLEKAARNMNNTSLYISLGNIYKEMGEFLKSENYYQNAHNMIPSRLYPMYLLLKLYDEYDVPDKALSIAKAVLKKESKIPSKAVNEIKEEARIIKDKYESLNIIVNPEGKRREVRKRKHTTSCLAPSPNTKKGGDVTKIETK